MLQTPAKKPSPEPHRYGTQTASLPQDQHKQRWLQGSQSPQNLAGNGKLNISTPRLAWPSEVLDGDKYA